MASCSNCDYEAEESFRFCPECGTQWIEPEEAGDPLIGRTLGNKYRIRETIGVGSMGRVYLAEQVALKKRIAIKILHRDLQVADEAVTRFQREGIAAGQIDHSSVLQIFDFDRTDDGLWYLAMEYVDGVNLKQWLSDKGPLPPDTATKLIRQILSTLVEAHSHGVVHRDLKPENIMVVERSGRSDGGQPGSRVRIKVLDFGLSKLVDTKVDLSMATVPGRLLGTPLYMAPEQWRGDAVDHRSDIYAAALILYEMLAGGPPFKASDITEAMVNTTQQEPPSLEISHNIPAGLDTIVSKGLAKAREERFQSAQDMVDALDALREGKTLTAPKRRAASRGSAGDAVASPGFRLGNGLGKIAVISAIVVIATGVMLWRSGDDSRATATLARSVPAAERSPDQGSYLRLLDDARNRLLGGDERAALNYVNEAIRAECVDAEAYVVRAEVFRSQGDDDTAAAEYQQALEMGGNDAVAAVGLGWIAMDRSPDPNDPEATLRRAEARFDHALEIQQGYEPALAGKAAVALRRGDPSAARRLLDTPELRASDNATVHLWRGRTCLAIEDATGAREAFIEAKRHDTRMWEAYQGLGDAYRMAGDPQAAEAQYRSALDTVPAADAVRPNLIGLLLEQERTAEAQEVLQPILSSAASDPSIRVLGAVVAQASGQTQQAIGFLESVRREESMAASRPRVLKLLATLHLEAGNAQAAATVCEEASTSQDLDPQFLTTWGMAQFRLGDHTSAAEILEQVIESTPKDAFVHYTLGVIYRDYLGDEEFALEHFQAHVANGGSDPRVPDWIRALGG